MKINWPAVVVFSTILVIAVLASAGAVVTTASVAADVQWCAKHGGHMARSSFGHTCVFPPQVNCDGGPGQ